MTDLRLYDYAASGNCYKARLLLAQLDRPYERVPVDIFAGETLTDEYAQINPARTKTRSGGFESSLPRWLVKQNWSDRRPRGPLRVRGRPCNGQACRRASSRGG